MKNIANVLLQIVTTGANVVHACCFTAQKVDCRVAFLQKRLKKQGIEMLNISSKILGFH